MMDWPILDFVFTELDKAPEYDGHKPEDVTGSWTTNPEGFVDVEGDFDCSSKKIVSLNGIRFGSVVGNFYCHNNQLTSLEGAPEAANGKHDDVVMSWIIGLAILQGKQDIKEEKKTLSWHDLVFPKKLT